MRIILVIALLLSSNVAIAKKKVEHKEQTHTYHSIFEIDTNNITVEICCLPKRKPNDPMTHVPIGSWF